MLSFQPKCVHFYACICAFASDPKLSEEFSYYINLIQLNVEDPPAIVQQNNDEDKIVGIGMVTAMCNFCQIFLTVPPYCDSLKISDLDNLATDDTDTSLLIFRDDTLTIHSLDGNRIDLDSINLDSSILSHVDNIVENIEVECERNLLDDNNIISQVRDI